MAFNHQQAMNRMRNRWRTGSVAACLSWPLDESTLTAPLFSASGQNVTYETRLSDWKKRIRLGVSATTRFTAENRKLEYTPGYFYQDGYCKLSMGRTHKEIFGDLASAHSTVYDIPPLPSSLIDQTALQQAIQSAYNDARQKQGSFKGSTFVAELRDTIRGLRNPALGIRRGLDDYTRSATRNVRRSLGGRSLPRTARELDQLGHRRASAARRALSDTWLEHQFGMIPLANDIADAYISGIRLSRRTPLVRFHGFGRAEYPVSETLATRVEDAVTLKWIVIRKLCYDVYITGAVRLDVDCPGSSKIEEFGFTCKDFVPAIWEAIPYSFLVDYFTNIGEVVNALSFPATDIAWCQRTYRNQSIRDSTRASWEWLSVHDTPTFRWEEPTVQQSTAYWSRELVDRLDYQGSLPKLEFRYEIPGSKNWRKWLNIAALANNKTLIT
jgi:hypothetical protein